MSYLFPWLPVSTVVSIDPMDETKLKTGQGREGGQKMALSLFSSDACDLFVGIRKIAPPLHPSIAQAETVVAPEQAFDLVAGAPAAYEAVTRQAPGQDVLSRVELTAEAMIRQRRWPGNRSLGGRLGNGAHARISMDGTDA
jgi:hypothetical protein